MSQNDSRNTERGVAVLEAAMLVALFSLSCIVVISASGVAITTTFRHATNPLCDDTNPKAPVSCRNLDEMRVLDEGPLIDYPPEPTVSLD